jgi:hypothetical protein
MAHDLHRRIVSRLGEQAHDVRRLTSGLDEETLSKRTMPGKWSLKEILCHLWRVQQIFEERIRAMLAQDNPAVVPYDPEGDPEFDKLVAASPCQDSLAGFLADRERLAAALESLSAAEWHRPGRHPEFPQYDLHFQVEYMQYHEAHHIYQMFQRRAPLGRLPH